MNDFEKVTTGLGEECGVFGAYDMDGGDVAPLYIMGFLHCNTEAGKLRNCCDRHIWREKGTVEKGPRTCK